MPSSAPVFQLPARLGRYTLTRRLGVGGMAEVFLAHQDGPAGFSKTCVVKRILPHLAEDAKFVQMFQREARVAAMLSHTNIVQIHELGHVDGVYFIAMEHVDGAPLHTLARTAWRQNKPIPHEVVCCAIADAALGLHAAHEQRDAEGRPLHLVHRDISPDNLIINREGITKVLDFGIAKTAMGERTATGELKGKIPFLSPEQVLGEPLDGRADLYALGVTLYWLLTGKRPLSAPSDLALMQKIIAEVPRPPKDLNPTIPDALDDLVMALLEKDRDKRPATGAAVHDALASATAFRRSVVAPFVTAVLSGPTDASEESGPGLIGGFLPSTPHTNDLRVSFVKNAVRADAPTIPVAPVRLDTAPTTSADRTAVDLSFDATLASTQSERRRRRPIAVTAALASVLSIGAVLGVLVLRAPTQDEDPVDVPSIPRPVDTSPDRLSTDVRSRDRAPVPVPVPEVDLRIEVEPAPAPPLDPAPARPDPSRTDHHREGASRSRGDDIRTSTREVVVKGPAAVLWQTDKGKVLGLGSTTLKVPSTVKRLVAVDQRTGGRTGIPLGAAKELPPIDYASLPTGKIQARANPYADVSIGAKSLGTTPFPPTDVVVGTYVVRFKHEGREETRTVEVKAGETVRVLVDFDAPSR